MEKMNRSFKRHIKNRKNKMEKFSSHFGNNVEKFTQSYGDLTVDIEIKKIESGSDRDCSEVDIFF